MASMVTVTPFRSSLFRSSGIAVISLVLESTLSCSKTNPFSTEKAFGK